MTDDLDVHPLPEQQKRGRGRPRGSKNQPKAAAPEGGNVSPEKDKPVVPMGNVTDETIADAIRDVTEHKGALETAQGSYRSALKRAKGMGIDPAFITWYLRQKKRDVSEIDRETAARNRIARIMGLPIGTQLGMFDDGRSVADHAETYHAGDDTLPSMEAPAPASNSGVLARGKAAMAAYNVGYAAGYAGADWDGQDRDGDGALDPAECKKGWQDGRAAAGYGIAGDTQPAPTLN